MKQFRILAALLFSFLGVTLAQSSDMGGNTDTPPTVTFNKNPIIVGIGAKRSSQTPDYPATTPPTLSHQVKATISPKAKAGGVTFTISDSARATVSPASRIDVGDTTEVILLVTGVTETPATAKGGDTDVQAVYEGKIISTAKVKVLKPTTRKNTIGPNQKWNTWVRLSANQSRLESNCSYLVTIEVKDQFGEILDSIYNGENIVSEKFSNFSSTVPNAPNPGTGWITMYLPDNKFINGIKGDECDIPAHVFYPEEGTAQERSDYARWIFTYLGDNNAYSMGTVQGVIKMDVKIKVDGYEVSPDYHREYEVKNVNFPDIPMILTESSK